MLKRLVDTLPSKPSLTEVRLAASSLLAYAAFLRFDELAKLRCCDVLFEQDRMSIHITSRKTDQYWEGDTVLVARTGSATCPIAMLECYMALAEIDCSSEVHLFYAISHTKHRERLRALGALSYTHMRELFLDKHSELGFNQKRLGLYSLRAGGAQLLPMLVCQIICSKDTADRSRRLPKMAMWKILLWYVWLFLKASTSSPFFATLCKCGQKIVACTAGLHPMLSLFACGDVRIVCMRGACSGRYTFLSFDTGIRYKICSQKLYYSRGTAVGVNVYTYCHM